MKLRSHSSNDATTDEEDGGKERSGDLHLPETDTIEEDASLTNELRTTTMMTTTTMTTTR